MRDTSAIESIQAELARDQELNKSNGQKKTLTSIVLDENETRAVLGTRDLVDTWLKTVTDKVKSLGATPSLATLTSAVKEALESHASANANKIEEFKGSKALQAAGDLARMQFADILDSHYRRILNAYVSASKVNFDRGAAKILPSTSLRRKLGKLADTVHAKFVTSASSLQKGGP